MRAFIYGAGRIGTYIGACLISADWEVLYIGRDRMLNEIKDNNGQLKISDYRGGETTFTLEKEFQYIIDLKTEDIKEGDYIIVTVKREQSREVAEHLRDLNLAVKVCIVSFQNGVGNTEIYQEYLPNQTILSAIFGANVIKVDEPAHFKLATTNPAVIEDIGEISKSLSSGLAAGKSKDKPYVGSDLHKDINRIIYGKLLLNLNNAVNALCGLTLEKELSERSCRKVLAACMQEAIKAMEANGISPAALNPLMQPKVLPKVMKLPSFIYLRLASSSLQVDPDARSSMWDDLSAGRKTEIDYLNGVVIELGKKADVPTPVNQAVYDLIKKAEEEGDSPRYSPDELVKLTGAN